MDAERCNILLSPHSRRSREELSNITLCGAYVSVCYRTTIVASHIFSLPQTLIYALIEQQHSINN